MRTCLAFLIASSLSLSALAAEPSCNAVAAEKKLAGAAKNSFLKKCEADAQARCDQSAADKKLAGAAKNSHVKKCMADSVGG